MGRFFLGGRFGIVLILILSSIVGVSYLLSDQWGNVSAWRLALLLTLWVALSMWSLQFVWRGQAKVWLSWNGHQWEVLSLYPVEQLENLKVIGCQVAAEDARSQDAYDLRVQFDLQHHLFVSLHKAQHQTLWFWVSKVSFPERWHGFRCAVYSRS